MNLVKIRYTKVFRLLNVLLILRRALYFCLLLLSSQLNLSKQGLQTHLVHSSELRQMVSQHSSVQISLNWSNHHLLATLLVCFA